MKPSPLLWLTVGLVGGVLIGLMVSAVGVTADTQVAVWLEVVQRVCTSVGGLGTLFALIFIVLQFKLLRRQLQLVQRNTAAAMSAQLYARLDNFNKFIVEHDQEYERLNQVFPGEETAENRSRLHHLCDLGFTFYEEIYKHHARYELLDTEDWDEWQQSMAHFFSKPYVLGYWKTTAHRYAKSFQAWAAELASAMELHTDGTSSSASRSNGPRSAVYQVAPAGSRSP